MVNEVFDFIREQLTPLSDIKTIDWYLDQENISGGIPLSPCVFVAFKPVQVNSLSKKYQEVVTEFDVMLYSDFKKQVSKLTNESPHIDIERSIRDVLWKFEEIGSEPMARAQGFIKSIVSYRHKWVEVKAVKPIYDIIPGEEIIPNIEII